MEWYGGNIAEAVSLSQQKRAVFCVFIFGENENSSALEKLVNEPLIVRILKPDNFICIKINEKSNEYNQFSQIYNSPPSPSIYCIGDKGIPLEIISSDFTQGSLKEKLDSVIAKHHKSFSGQQTGKNTNSINALASSSQGICGVIASTTDAPKSETSECSEAEKLERAQQLIEAQRVKKEKNAEEEAKKKEIERREMGKNVAELKRWQEEEEMKRILDERKKDKREDMLLRQRVKEQIARDRAERNARSNLSYVNDEPRSMGDFAASNAISTQNSTGSKDGMTRLQFRLPTGSRVSHSFQEDETLKDVKHFLIESNAVSFSNFSFWQAFPRKEFTDKDYTSSLKALGLTPSAVLIILNRQSGSGQSYGNHQAGLWILLTSLMGYIFYPFSFIFNFIQSTFPSIKWNTQDSGTTGSPRRPPDARTNVSTNTKDAVGPATPGGSSKRRTDRSRGGNVHRLHEDSDDEQATYNGNSTQQM